MEIKKALIIIDIQNDYFEGGANPLIGSIEASICGWHLMYLGFNDLYDNIK